MLFEIVYVFPLQHGMHPHHTICFLHPLTRVQAMSKVCTSQIGMNVGTSAGTNVLKLARVIIYISCILKAHLLRRSAAHRLLGLLRFRNLTRRLARVQAMSKVCTSQIGMNVGTSAGTNVLKLARVWLIADGWMDDDLFSQSTLPEAQPRGPFLPTSPDQLPGITVESGMFCCLWKVMEIFVVVLVFIFSEHITDGLFRDTFSRNSSPSDPVEFSTDQHSGSKELARMLARIHSFGTNACKISFRAKMQLFNWSKVCLAT